MELLKKFLEGRSQRDILLITVTITLFFGIVDHFIGSELSTSIFYILPITIAAWYGHRRLGIAICLLATLTWYITDITSGHVYSHPAILYWNTTVRLGIFLLITNLLASFREHLLLEATAADSDSLTGILNARGFHERLAEEYRRAQRYRHPLTIAYLDLDNFKQVNDRYGHSVGDQLLYEVAQTLHNKLRHTDVAARLGGDEFAVMLLESDYAASNQAFHLVHRQLQQIMQQHQWPVTFSIGMVTFESLPPHPKEIIRIVDELMYSVKKNQKNAIAHLSWRASDQA